MTNSFYISHLGSAGIDFGESCAAGGAIVETTVTTINSLQPNQGLKARFGDIK
jgi:hypothetical protein